MNKFKTSTMVMSVFIMLIMSVPLEAQSISNFGKMQITDGRLNFVVNPNNSFRSSSTQTGSIIKTIRFERTENGAKLDMISKASDKIQALRINDKDVAICIIHTNKKEGTPKKNNGIKFYSNVELSAFTLNPMLSLNDSTPKNKKGESVKSSSVLIQKDSAPIRFLVQTDESTLLEFQAQSIWNLIAIVPSPQRKVLFELLQVYDSTLFSDEQSMMFQILNAIANIPQINDVQQKEYQQLVEDLSSDIYLKRVTAINKIQEEGQAFLQFAKKINLDTLDIEARICLSKVLTLHSSNDTDSAESLTYQFMGMDYAYILLLESDNPEHIQQAQKKLKLRLGDQFHYEPTADETTRLEQLEKIKEALKCPKVNVIKMDKTIQEQFQSFTDAICNTKQTEFKFNCEKQDKTTTGL